MESLSKQELISTITKQAEQVKRYESRLRDVVTAYKGLAKEKEALEISLKALNKPEQRLSENDSDSSVSALTLSLSTLTTEKTRMEEAFQADKKLTREKYESKLSAMKEEMKSLMQQNQVEMNNLKAKLAYEIQEREKERADHSAMMKELQNKLNVELLNKDKADVTPESQDVSKSELEKKVRDLSGELEAVRRRLARAEARSTETPALLVRLQEKMALLEQTHAIAIREEQIKGRRLEEAARRACAAAEARVAALEAALADLSRAAGESHAHAQRDKDTIRHLQEELNRRLLAAADTNEASISRTQETTQKSETDNEKLADSEYLQTLIDKIHILKKELVAENEKLNCPIDINSVFKIEGYQNAHYKCREDYDRLKAEFDAYVRHNAAKEEDRSFKVIQQLNAEINGLKTEVDVFKNMIEEEREEKLSTFKMYEDKLKSEKEYHFEVVSDLKSRLSHLEKQIHTHRERYAALLAETDSLLKARNSQNDLPTHNNNQDGGAPPHMLHYAHELARKDLDISQLRREKHTLEGQLRDIQRDSTIEKERFKEVRRTLKEEIDRLRRSQSREGANLEYLKNVVYSYLVSADYAGRKHMLNAIAAVLHFTDHERNSVLATL